jgi:hypothetical protein
MIYFKGHNLDGLEDWSTCVRHFTGGNNITSLEKTFDLLLSTNLGDFL